MERMGHRVGVAAKAVIGVGAAIAGSQIIGKLTDMAKAGLETASALGEQATQLGVSTSALQRYRFIASQIGIEQAEMDKGLSKLSLTLGKLSVGTEKQRESLEKYGFTTAEVARLAKLSSEDALPLLADKYRALTSETERSAFVAEFFTARLGGKFKTLLEGGAEGVNKLAEAYKKLGIEISPEQIAAADEAMDKQAQNQLVLQAKIAQLAGNNAEQITKASLAWEEFKIQALSALADTLPHLENFARGADNLAKDLDRFGKQSGLQSGLQSIGRFLVESGQHFVANQRAYEAWAHGVREATIGAVQAVGRMVHEIGAAITGRLNAIWEGAKAKVAQVKAAFFDLWTAVTRRSYVPDMVDDIATQMARLDSVLVAPAKKATEATKRAFEQMRNEVSGILDRLFPDEAETNAFRGDSAAITAAVKAKAISGALGEEAQRRLQRERMGLDPNETSGPTAIEDVGSLVKPIDAVEDALERLGQKAKVTTVQVAKTFKDMADATLASLSRLSSAIKGGGFLGILEAVIGLGLQLGSIGAFGKGIAKKINTPSTPPINGYASGTFSAARGLALVGERGPELVNFRGGERVWNSRQSRGMGGSEVVIRPTPYFEAVVDGRVIRAAPAMMAGGAQVAQTKLAYRQSRRVA